MESGFWHSWHNGLTISNTDRIYLPIFWTNNYCRYGFRSNMKVQQFLDTSIRDDRRYFTVVQNADGVLERLPRNVKVFAAGGVGDVPIPLLCDSHARRRVPRDVLASFVGILHHWANNRKGVRSRMLNELCDNPDICIVEASADRSLFETMMERSVFALCPRGYGKTSFRLYEAMQMGAIPVYIYDEPWLPYTELLNWREFCVPCHIDDIHTLTDNLRSIPYQAIEAMRAAAEAYWPSYFTMTGTSRQIARMLREEMIR